MKIRNQVNIQDASNNENKKEIEHENEIKHGH